MAAAAVVEDDIWESDLYPLEAWESAGPQPARRPAVASDDADEPRPAVVDKAGEVWEDDLYSLDAWVHGAEEFDTGASSSSPQPQPQTQQQQQPASLQVRHVTTAATTTTTTASISRSNSSNNSNNNNNRSRSRSRSRSPRVRSTSRRSARSRPPVSAPPPRRAPPATASQETHEEVFWPNIESYISKPEGSKPIVTCVICQSSELVVPGLQDADAAKSQEPLVVVPCGHVVGETCFREWEAVAQPPVKCPVCNYVVDWVD